MFIFELADNLPQPLLLGLPLPGGLYYRYYRYFSNFNHHPVYTITHVHLVITNALTSMQATPTRTCSEYLSHEHLGHLLRLDPCALQGLAHGQPSQLVGRQRGQAPVQAAYGSPGGAEYVHAACFSHGFFLRLFASIW